MGARDNLVGEGTLLQAGRSPVWVPDEVDFFSIYLILLAALWLCGRLSLEQKWVPGIFLGIKNRPVCRADKLAAIYEPNVKMWEP
jgi:hypothetical protein